MWRAWLLKISMILSLMISPLVSAGDVVVSNYPLWLLGKAVAGDLPAPTLLLQKGDVGHHAELSPHDVAKVKSAQYVVWFGDDLESNLAQVLNHAPNAISLFNMNAFHRLPKRNVDATPIAQSFDPHIWYDKTNAKAIAAALAVVMGHANPAHKDQYSANAKAFAQRLDSLPVTAPKPYWAHHDAYQYFEKQGFVLSGTLTTDHELPIKITQIRNLGKHRPRPSMCLVAQHNIAKGVLDKLMPVKSVVLSEDLSEFDDFVQAMQTTYARMNACIDNA